MLDGMCANGAYAELWCLVSWRIRESGSNIEVMKLLPAASMTCWWKAMSAATKAGTSFDAAAARISARDASMSSRSSAVRRSAASSATATSTTLLASMSLRGSASLSASCAERAISSTGSRTDQWSGGFTNVPRPCSTRTTSLAAMALTASRTVSRLTPVCAASSVSLGSGELAW